MVGVGSDAMDFHALEGLQCMVDRRKGEETGAADQGRRSRELLEAGFSRSDTLLGVSETASPPQNLANNGEFPKLVLNLASCSSTTTPTPPPAASAPRSFS